MALGFSDLEYIIPYIFTVLVILTKIILAIYLYSKVKKKKENEVKAGLDFLNATLILMLFLVLSRTLYFIFDFHLTYLDESNYHLFPNIWVWKTATVLAVFPIAYYLYIIDKKIFELKFKGIFAFITMLSGIIQFAYPVNSAEDFRFISIFGFVQVAMSLILPITFLYIGAKSTGSIRITAFLITIAIIVYGISGQLVSETFLSAIAGTDTGIRLTIFVISSLMRMIGLILVAYGTTRFRF